MKRKVVIEDTAVETLAEAMLGLVSQVENLANEVRAHQHQTQDMGLEGGSKWSGLNNSFVALSFEAVTTSLADIKKSIEDLLPK